MYVLLMKTENGMEILGTAETEERAKLAYLSYEKTFKKEMKIVKTYSFDSDYERKRLIKFLTQDIEIH